jgi:gliding motility-associated-like protein
MKKILLSGIAIIQFMLLWAANGPVAKNDTAQVGENGPVAGNTFVIIPVTANDMDSTGGLLTVTLPAQPQHGQALVINTNQVLYSPDTLFYGIDSFRYSVCDTFHLCDTATVYVNVLGSNLPPVAFNDIFSLSDTLFEEFLNVIANDTDPHHDTIFVKAVYGSGTPDNLGTLGIDSANGLVLFVHAPYSCGAENFTYVVCNYSLCDTAQITIIINCPDSISLPRGFSPNGDGKNDLLVFTGLEYFEPASLKVFNRYGAIVYQNSAYQNNWDGTDLDTHNALPDGTYFYVLQLANNHTYNSYLVINR